MKHLYFCRHGQSEANVARVWSGTMESPLTTEGKAQAKLAGKHAKNLKIDHIVASPLGRARDTAAIIAKEIGFPVDDIELNSLLIERHYGQLEGQPADMDSDIDGFLDVESRDSLLERARLTLELLQSMPHESVLIVSHGTFGRALRSLTHPHIPFKSRDHENRFANADIIKLI